MKDRNKDKSDNSEIIESLACLFKSLLLPSEIKNDVINELKLKDKYDFLALLAECQGINFNICFFIIHEFILIHLFSFVYLI